LGRSATKKNYRIKQMYTKHTTNILEGLGGGEKLEGWSDVVKGAVE
jgi:hypothetical protein